MSDDLISRKALYERVEKSMYENPHSDSKVRQIHNHEYAHFLCMIMQEPTAFDKEKVKEQIQIFRSKFECACCPKNIGKHIPVSCDECMDTFAKASSVIVEKGGIE